MKNDLRFCSSLCGGGSVCARVDDPPAVADCPPRADNHEFTPASSAACNKNSPPIDNLKNNANLSTSSIIRTRKYLVMQLTLF